MLNITLSRSQEPAPENVLEMWISPAMEQMMMPFFEIEMLQAGRELLEDGQIHYRLILNDEKGAATKNWLMSFLINNDLPHN